MAKFHIWHSSWDIDHVAKTQGVAKRVDEVRQAAAPAGDATEDCKERADISVVCEV